MSDAASMLGSPLFERLAWTLTAFLWQGTLVAAFLAAVNAALRDRRPGIRYAAACGAMLMMLILPIATFAGRSSAADVTAPLAVRPVSSGRAFLSIPDAVASDSPAGAFARAIRASSASLAPWLVPGWICGVLLLSLRFLGGWRAAWKLSHRRASTAPPSLQWRLERLAARVRVSRPVLLVQSAAVSVPTALGALRPMILLPVSALAGLSPEALEAVLAHELAHIRRHDYLVNLLQTAVETLLFYHPAVWWVSHRIRVERESCCDDVAVAVTGDPGAYARALVGLEQIRCEPRLAVAASGGALHQRITRLLRPPASPADGALRWPAALLTLAAVGAIGAAARISAFADVGSPFAIGAGEAAPKRVSTAATARSWKLLLGAGEGVSGGVRGGVSGGAPGGARAGVPGGVSGGVSGGVIRGVVADAIGGEGIESAGEAPDEEPARTEKIAAARPSSPEELARLRRHGVTPEFLGALAALGYKQASVDELVSARIHGITPEYISAMTELFGKQSLDELVSLRIHGVTPEFVRAFRDAGYTTISADEAQSLRIHGVSPEEGAEWTRLLKSRPELDEIVSASIHGATPDFAREMRSLGLEGDLDTLVSLRIHAVTPDFVRAMRSLGYSKLSADEAVSARIHGVTPDFAREIQSLGYESVSLDELTSLRSHGVTAEFLREQNGSSGSRLSIDELLERRIHWRKR
jgi:beta-lactamase regulating signal transducer with metallopeptidase domain